MDLGFHNGSVSISFNNIGCFRDIKQSYNDDSDDDNKSIVLNPVMYLVAYNPQNDL